MNKRIIVFACMGAALLLHTLFQRDGFSLFLAPISIPVIIAVAPVFSPLLAILIIIALELLSSLPPGSILLAWMVPIASKSLWKTMEKSISWRFFLFVSIAITLELVLLTAIRMIVFRYGFSDIPFQTLLLQGILTSISTCVLAGIVYES